MAVRLRPFRLAYLAVAAVVVLAAAVLWPYRSAQPPFRFTDVTDAAGIHFTHTNGAAGRKLLPETMGSGVAVIDYDGDGRPDLFFVNGRSWPGDPGIRATQAFYHNRGDGTFEDVTVAVGLDVELFGMGATVADYDGDGRPDLFVTAIGANKLFRNIDGKRFEDVTDTAGVGGSRLPEANFFETKESVPFPSSATWVDYDVDGRPDLFVCYYLTWSPAADLAVRAVLPNGVRAYVPPTQFPAADCVLYRNIDGKRFEDVSAAVGVRVSDPGPDGKPHPVGKPLGVVAGDPDGDGFPDLLVACDTTRNLFFHNRGGKTFVETGLSANVAYADGRPRGGMGIDAAELTPGGFTAVIANFSNEPNTLLDRRRPSPLGFVDMAQQWGLAGPTRGPMKFGALFFDADADGRPDLFTANGHLEPDIAVAQSGQTHAQSAQLFLNTGDRWLEVMGLFPAMVGRGCATLDYDGDGDLDLVVTANGGPAKLFRNDSPARNRTLQLDLAGRSLGTTVKVEAAGRTWTQYRTAARGYLSQSSGTLTFGLGTADRVDRVTIRWPGGKVQEWTGLTTGRYRLSEGNPTAERR